MKLRHTKRKKIAHFDSRSVNIVASSMLLMTAVITSTVLSAVQTFIQPQIAHVEGGRFERMAHTANVISGNVPVSSALKAVRIEAEGPSTIETYASLRLTAIGEFVSGSMPIKAKWYARLAGKSDIELKQCASKEQCDFSTDAPGSVEINAVAGGKIGYTTVNVVEPRASTFIDQVPDWASSSISRLQSFGVIRGYDDGRFGAADSLTRGQVMVLFTRVLTMTNLSRIPTQCSPTSLVPVEHYAYDAYCLFNQQGWEAGWNSNPDEPMTRGETASYINRVFGHALLQSVGTSQGALLSGGPYFVDVATDDTYFYDTAVTKFTGIMTGNPDGTFKSYDTLNRAQGATVIDRLLHAIEDRGIRDL